MVSLEHRWKQEGMLLQKVKDMETVKAEKITMVKNLIKAGLITNLIANSTGLKKKRYNRISVRSPIDFLKELYINQS